MNLLECVSYDHHFDQSVALCFSDDPVATVKLEFLFEEPGRAMSHRMLYRYYDAGAHSC